MTTHQGDPQVVGASASIHGYHLAFAVGAGFLALATILAAVLVNAHTDELRAEPQPA